MKISKLSIAAASLLLALPAFADELAVLDCSGTVRATSIVESGSTNQIAVAISSTGSALPVVFDVSISNKSSQTDRSGKAVDGKLLIRDVAPGQWTLCLENQNFVVDHVNIITETRTGVYASEVALGGVGAAGLATAVGLSLGGSSSSDESTLLVQKPEGTVSVQQQSSESQTMQVAAATSDDDRREACMTGEKPTPLSPFL